MVVAAKGMTELSGGVNINRNPTLQVAWAFESCARLITGGIKVWVLGLMPERCLRRQQAAETAEAAITAAWLGSGGNDRQRLQLLHVR